ncbi:hypothetical protein [Luteimonas vadosa]|uniref:Uncharacterized protein n=1 Tax=Luteimonas vadosa TaxID=1165507 RepID=A0ABP9DYH9_9GAMM
MKNENPTGGHARFAGAGQRLLVLLVFAVFAGLVWLAWSGRFDAEVQQVAAWLSDRYASLSAWVRRNL